MDFVTQQIDKVPGVAKKVLRDKRVLSFYNDPPREELSLDDFERYSFDRLQLLRKIENLKNRNLDREELGKKIADAENLFFAGSVDVEKQDIASHFILRLAYCRTEDLRRWFLSHECALFQKRFEALRGDEQKLFMHQNGLEFEVASDASKLDRRDLLIGLAGVDSKDFEKIRYYKIPFQQALSLTSQRRIYLEGGYAWVPLQHLMSIIVGRHLCRLFSTQYRSHLSRALAEATRLFPTVVEADPRIKPVLQNMHKQFLGKDFSKTQSLDKLTPDKVDQAAENNMPLCAKFMHMGLKREHKLKHWARLQYGLFLKAAGLSLEDALVFWEGHFTRCMTHDQFVKGYSYAVRHMYGKEGARKDYTPPSCFKIIMGTPPEAGAYHGCPYKHATDSQLASLLTGLKLGGAEVKDIVAQAKSGNYQLACLRHFEVTHPGYQSMDNLKSEGLADHPNQWFRVSVQYHKAKSGVCPDANAHPVTRPTHGESLPQMRNNVDLTIARPDETDIMTATIFESAKNNNNIQVNTDMSLQKRGRDWEGEDNEPATDNAELT